MDKFEILVAGTGGQGVIFLGNLLDRAARLSGFKTVIGSEIHGMAQRGGSLVSHTRFGNDVHGPIISVGSADVIIGLEYVEGLRNIEYLSKTGWMVVAETMLPSSAMWVGGLEYPRREEVLAAIRKVTDRVTVINAEGIAKQVGNINAANTVMLGVTVAAVEAFPIAPDCIKEAIKAVFPSAKLVGINIKAFEEGMAAVQK